jgi:hypothetical protein
MTTYKSEPRNLCRLVHAFYELGVEADFGAVA